MAKRRNRDYAAERARRLELGRQRGLTTAQAYGHAKRARQKSITQLRREGALPTPQPAPPPKALPTPRGGQILRTGSQKMVKQLVASAAAGGLKVMIRARVRTGKGWRSGTLDGHGDEATLLLGAAQLRAAGTMRTSADTGNVIGDLTGRTNKPRVEVTTDTDGMDPIELTDWFAIYANVWDAIADLFGEEWS